MTETIPTTLDHFYKSYKWERLTELVAGCSLCENLSMHRCDGQESGKACKLYKCRNDAGEECRSCGFHVPSKTNRGTGYCTAHMSEITPDDYSCYLYDEHRRNQP